TVRYSGRHRWWCGTGGIYGLSHSRSLSTDRTPSTCLIDFMTFSSWSRSVTTTSNVPTAVSTSVECISALEMFTSEDENELVMFDKMPGRSTHLTTILAGRWTLKFLSHSTS